MVETINFQELLSEEEIQESKERFANLKKQKVQKETRRVVGSDISEPYSDPRDAWIRIHLDFQDIIPELTDDEFEGLEKSIVKDGCLDPIRLWKGYIVDGHNRYEICLRNNMSFRTVSMEFKDEDEAKIWILENQFNRRNLDSIVKIELNGKLDELRRSEAQKNSSNNNRYIQAAKKEGDNECQNFGTRRNEPKTQDEKNRDRVNTRIAKPLGMSGEQYRRGKIVLDSASPEDISSIKAGEKTINKVYSKLRREEREKILRSSALPEGKYRVFYVDPPWKYGTEPLASTEPQAAGYFPVVTIEELCEIPIHEISEKNAALFLWVIPPLLPEALKVMSAWGFEYRAVFTWDKGKDAKCKDDYNNVNQEFLLVGEKGNCIPESDDITSAVQHIPKNLRSAAKPDEFRKIIETLYYATKNKVELYARKECEGWSRYHY